MNHSFHKSQYDKREEIKSGRIMSKVQGTDFNVMLGKAKVL